jgi:protein-S-isoprenylcysteine O-methyltransferase Ste14
MSLFVQALLAFLVLPGVVGYLVPLLFLPPADELSIHLIGLLPLVLGTALLLWCVRDFYVSGKGTLAPWSPPQNLVVTGLYRHSRNPMYIAVALVLCGWALTFHSLGLAIYALVVVVAFHLRVVLNEEPFLARTHGDQWVKYRTRVPRWLF